MLTASASVVAVPCLGAVSPASSRTGERAAVLGQVDGLGRGSHHRDPGRLERPGQPERCLPAELHDHAFDGPLACSARTTSSTSSRVSGSKYSRPEVS